MKAVAKFKLSQNTLLLAALPGGAKVSQQLLPCQEDSGLHLPL